MEVRIRNIDEWVVEWHRTQAKSEGKSLEALLRQILTESATARKQAFARELRSELKAFRSEGRVFSDSAALIREDRDERG
jgi:plasmid stability protein